MRKKLHKKKIMKFGIIICILLFTNILTFLLTDYMQHEPSPKNIVKQEVNSNKIENINIEKIKESSFLIDSSKVKDIDNVVIVAHPDDETLWAGNYITKEKCLVLCITNGDNVTRKKEFFEVMKATGNYGIILNYPDNPNKIKSTWKIEKNAIMNDLKYLINYKSWKRIITHNPEGEYGHIQHRFTSMMVTNICVKNGIENRLFYFEKYMKKNKINGLQATLGNDQIQFKHSLMQLYPSQINAYQKFQHMMLYETLISYNEWYFG